MWPKYFPLTMLVYNTFKAPNLANYSCYKLVFGRKPNFLLDLGVLLSAFMSSLMNYLFKKLSIKITIVAPYNH